MFLKPELRVEPCMVVFLVLVALALLQLRLSHPESQQLAQMREKDT